MLASERGCGRFTRELFLDERVDSEHIEASDVDGVLTVSIPLIEREPRKVEIAPAGYLDAWRPLADLADDFTPLADIEELDDAYVVEVEVPWVQREHVDIDVSGRRVRVRGERKAKERVGILRRRERTVGRFSSEVVLPDEVDDEHVEVRMEDGAPNAAATSRRRVPPGDGGVDLGFSQRRVRPGTAHELAEAWAADQVHDIWIREPLGGEPGCAIGDKSPSGGEPFGSVAQSWRIRLRFRNSGGPSHNAIIRSEIRAVAGRSLLRMASS